jgi:uncharacterized membrane protein YqaE (UPF0057 family)
MHQSLTYRRRRSYQHLNSFKNSNNMAECPTCCKSLLLVLLIFLIPPLAVFFVEKKCSSTVILNLILYLLFWIPGVIHALYVIYFS